MTKTIDRREFLLGAAATAMAVAMPSQLFAQASKLKVAGVHASPVENAWNSRLHGAMQKAAADGLIEYVFSEGVSAGDYPRAMREYADGGAQLIVGEAYAVEAEARQVAQEYPDTAFLMGSSGEPAGENFGVFGTWNHEAAYLAGMLAGQMTKTGTIGSVGAIPIPEVNMVINAFRAGAMEVKPDVKHLVGFIGTFFDPPKAREAGLAQIDAGADILYGERIGTADAAKDRGVKAVGNMVDYTPRYPETVFANAIWNFDPLLRLAVADKTAGTPTAKNYTPLSLMKQGGNDISFTPAMVPAEALAVMEAKRRAIKDGSFTVVIDTAEPK